MPVVDADELSFSLLNRAGESGINHLIWIEKSKISQIHDEYEGGKDVAFLVVKE